VSDKGGHLLQQGHWLPALLVKKSCGHGRLTLSIISCSRRLLLPADAVMEMAGIAEGQLDADGMPLLPGAGTGELPYSIQVGCMRGYTEVPVNALACGGTPVSGSVLPFGWFFLLAHTCFLPIFIVLHLLPRPTMSPTTRGTGARSPTRPGGGSGKW
jgi:hypothetical protein